MNRTSSLASLIRIALIGLGLTIAAASADAKGHRPGHTELSSTEEAAARAEIAKAKRDGQRARAKLKALRAQSTATKAQKRADKAAAKAARAAWLVKCIDERTSGDEGGLEEDDAALICADAAAAMTARD